MSDPYTRAQERPPDQVNPPLLIGGLRPRGKSEKWGAEALGRGVDWLTVSMPDAVAELMLGQTADEVEAGVARPGFARSEKRLTMGGFGWRRWEPRQACREWGMCYESWEFSGDSAGWPAGWLRGRTCRPSRVDVTWDFNVAEGLTPDDLVALLEDPKRPGYTRTRLKLGVSGEGGVHTRYIGARNSPRRVRLYRKDRESELWGETYGPTMRVEAILRQEHAAAWWGVWDQDEEAGYAAAAGIIAEMSGGLLVQHGVGPVPQIVPVEGADEAAELWQFIRQHGHRVAEWAAAKIDVVKLALMHRQRATKPSHHRAVQLRRRLERAGPARVTKLVECLIRDEPARRVSRRRRAAAALSMVPAA